MRLNDRPNIRIDNGNIADTGVITNVSSMHYVGAEAAGVFGPLTVAGEAGKLWLDRFNVVNNSFTGYYGYAAYMLTGETRPSRPAISTASGRSTSSGTAGLALLRSRFATITST